jgi:hypothetical protein
LGNCEIYNPIYKYELMTVIGSTGPQTLYHSSAIKILKEKLLFKTLIQAQVWDYNRDFLKSIFYLKIY